MSAFLKPPIEFIAIMITTFLKIPFSKVTITSSGLHSWHLTSPIQSSLINNHKICVAIIRYVWLQHDLLVCGLTCPLTTTEHWLLCYNLGVSCLYLPFNSSILYANAYTHVCTRRRTHARTHTHTHTHTLAHLAKKLVQSLSGEEEGSAPWAILGVHTCPIL